MGMNVNYNKQLDIALNVPVVKYTGVNSEYNKNIIQSCVAFFALVVDEFKYGIQDPTKHARILAHINTFTASGNEPSGEVQHFWHYPILTSAIALAKRTSTIWGSLSQATINRLDFIMKMFAIGANFISNDKNAYRTGFTFRGDVYKEYTANFRLSLVGPIIACADYFGGSDNLDAIFENFDYDSFIEEMENYGFSNMTAIWTTPTSEYNSQTIPGVSQLLTTGGQAYVKEAVLGSFNLYDGGSGEGVKIPYLYKGMRAGDKDLLIELLSFCYSGGTIISKLGTNEDGSYQTYIMNNKTSPYEGLDGLMLEFNTVDPNLRSDGNYCEIDFIMSLALLMLCKASGLWSDIENIDLYKKIWNGTNDLFFKLKNGYMSYSLLRSHVAVETNIIGYSIAKEMFNEFFENPEEII